MLELLLIGNSFVHVEPCLVVLLVESVGTHWLFGSENQWSILTLHEHFWLVI